MREVTDSELEELVGSEKPVVVDFWAPWCKPCRAIRPILEELERQGEGRVAFAGVDVDDQPEAGARYDVLSLPTVILVEAGEERVRVVGARGKGHFERELAPWLSGSGPSS